MSMIRSLSVKRSFKRSESTRQSYQSLDKENQSPLFAPVYWMSEDDVKARSIWDWCMAHSSMCPPLHRFYGTANLTHDYLQFQGTDQKAKDPSQRRVDMYIFPEQIIDVHRGFDKVFSRWEDRSVGIAFKPLRIRYRDDFGAIQTLYCVFNFNMVSRSDDGKLWCEQLEQWVFAKGLKTFAHS